MSENKSPGKMDLARDATRKRPGRAGNGSRTPMTNDRLNVEDATGMISPPPEETLHFRRTSFGSRSTPFNSTPASNSSSKRKRTTPMPLPAQPLEATPNPKPRKQVKHRTALTESPTRPSRSTAPTTPIHSTSPLKSNRLLSKSPHALNPDADFILPIPSSSSRRASRRTTPIPAYEPPSDVFTPPRVVILTPSIVSKSSKRKSTKRATANELRVVVKKEPPNIDLSLPMPPPSPSDDPLLLSGPIEPPSSTPVRPRQRQLREVGVATSPLPQPTPRAHTLPPLPPSSSPIHDDGVFDWHRLRAQEESTDLSMDVDGPAPIFDFGLPGSSDVGGGWTDSEDEQDKHNTVESSEVGEGEYTGRFRMVRVRTKLDPPSSATRERMEEWGRPITPFPRVKIGKLDLLKEVVGEEEEEEDVEMDEQAGHALSAHGEEVNEEQRDDEDHQDDSPRTATRTAPTGAFDFETSFNDDEEHPQEDAEHTGREHELAVTSAQENVSEERPIRQRSLSREEDNEDRYQDRSVELEQQSNHLAPTSAFDFDNSFNSDDEHSQDPLAYAHVSEAFVSEQSFEMPLRDSDEQDEHLEHDPPKQIDELDLFKTAAEGEQEDDEGKDNMAMDEEEEEEHEVRELSVPRDDDEGQQLESPTPIHRASPSAFDFDASFEEGHEQAPEHVNFDFDASFEMPLRGMEDEEEDEEPPADIPTAPQEYVVIDQDERNNIPPKDKDAYTHTQNVSIPDEDDKASYARTQPGEDAHIQDAEPSLEFGEGDTSTQDADASLELPDPETAVQVDPCTQDAHLVVEEQAEESDDDAEERQVREMSFVDEDEEQEVREMSFVEETEDEAEEDDEEHHPAASLSPFASSSPAPHTQTQTERWSPAPVTPAVRPVPFPSVEEYHSDVEEDMAPEVVDTPSVEGESSDDEVDFGVIKITSADPRAAARAAAILKQHDYDCYTKMMLKQRRHARHSLAASGIVKSATAKNDAKRRRMTLGASIVGDKVFIPGSPVVTLPELLREAEAEVRASTPVPNSISHPATAGAPGTPLARSLFATPTRATTPVPPHGSVVLGPRMWTKEEWKLLDACFTDERLELGRAGLAPVDLVRPEDVVGRFVRMMGGAEALSTFGEDWNMDNLFQRVKALQNKQRKGNVAPPTTPYTPGNGIGNTFAHTRRMPSMEVPDFTPLGRRAPPPARAHALRPVLPPPVVENAPFANLPEEKEKREKRPLPMSLLAPRHSHLLEEAVAVSQLPMDVADQSVAGVDAMEEQEEADVSLVLAEDDPEDMEEEPAAAPQDESTSPQEDESDRTIGTRVKGFLFSYLPTLSKTAPASRAKATHALPRQPGLPLPPPSLLEKQQQHRGHIATPVRAPAPKAPHPKELVHLHPAPPPKKPTMIPRVKKPQRLVELHHVSPVKPKEVEVPRPRRSSGGSVKDLVKNFEEIRKGAAEAEKEKKRGEFKRVKSVGDWRKTAGLAGGANAAGAKRGWKP
ncbi:hypothetical protein H0H81_012248 [Sphagnurus paluster]|uniref:Uncharacterized protein n=1 Tax=Sphagnurus paluster TaxID=117069 RepID=A0A9P7GMV3_9AGAR|nr:hypothetical protein H0H81_012248 [Sphagnurus paluster]